MGCLYAEGRKLGGRVRDLLRTILKVPLEWVIWNKVQCSIALLYIVFIVLLFMVFVNLVLEFIFSYIVGTVNRGGFAQGGVKLHRA
jgi:hypothetical protein